MIANTPIGTTMHACTLQSLQKGYTLRLNTYCNKTYSLLRNALSSHLFHCVVEAQCSQQFSFVGRTTITTALNFNMSACFSCNETLEVGFFLQRPNPFEGTTELSNSSNVMVLPSNILRVADPGMLFAANGSSILICGSGFYSIFMLG